MDKYLNFTYWFSSQLPGEFDLAIYLFAFMILLVIFSFAFDFFVKKIDDKFLKKSLKGNMGHIKWTFPLFGLLFIVSRLESIPLFNIRIFWVVWILSFFIYLFFLIRKIRKKYTGKLKNQERFGK